MVFTYTQTIFHNILALHPRGAGKNTIKQFIPAYYSTNGPKNIWKQIINTTSTLFLPQQQSTPACPEHADGLGQGKAKKGACTI